MEISELWSYLYSNNSKLQAFAVSEDSKIVWQTDNWNLVDSIEEILEACITNRSKIEVAGVKFTTMHASDKNFIASSGEKGHFLMAKVDHRTNTWLMVWSAADSDPELAIIDLKYAATKMLSF
jgi:hypothetical protein